MVPMVPKAKRHIDDEVRAGDGTPGSVWGAATCELCRVYRRARSCVNGTRGGADATVRGTAPEHE